MWATTWGAEANTFIAPVLGLPDLPVVEWPPGTSRERTDGPFWKTGPLVEHARGRPFAWVDDELGPADEDFVAAQHCGPALLLRIDDRTFHLVGGGADAWAPDARADAEIVAAMRSGVQMRVETRSVRGLRVRDHYQLRGAATAIDAAAIACARGPA